MSRKALTVNPSQGTLIQEIVPGELVPAEAFPSDPAEKLFGHSTYPPVTYGEPGQYVDLAERSELLTQTLLAFGKRNQRLGFDVASHARQYSSPIWGRYRGWTPVVQEGAEANSEVFLHEAKVNFWHATGFSALRGIGLVSDREIDAHARKMWRGFVAQYGDPEHRLQRDAYKRQLSKLSKTTHQMIKRAA